MVEPQTPATAWGNAVHKGLENRVKNGMPLPANMSQYEKFGASLDMARAGGAKVEAEKKLAINAHHQVVTYFASDAWCRSIADVTVERGAKAAVIDWKTGKPTPESAQLKLAAAFVFITKPYIEEVKTSFVWLAHDHAPTEETVVRDDLPEIWDAMNARVSRVTYAIDNDKFPKRPSGLCRAYCPVGKALCEHCGS